MIDFEKGEIKDILPHWLKVRPDVQAISYAIKQQVNLLRTYLFRAYGYAFVDGAPEYILDLMAVELNIWYYDTSYAIDVKRSLIKNAFQVAMKNGTSWAVERVLDAIYGEGTGAVSDWYEYGGIPNHFRVNLNRLSTQKEIDTMKSLIESVKRKTARLDGVAMYVEITNDMYFGAVTLVTINVYVECEGAEGTIIDPDADTVGYLDDELEQSLIDEMGVYLTDPDVPYSDDGGNYLADEDGTRLMDELSNRFLD